MGGRAKVHRAGGGQVIATATLVAVLATQGTASDTPQEPGVGPAPPVEVDRLRARERELLERIAILETELRAERARSLARQEEWLAFTRLLQGFEIPALPDPPEFLAEALIAPRDPAAEALERTENARRIRGAQVAGSLRTLLKAEGVRGFDLLEVGLLHQHEGRAWTGPVIARLLDERGRMVGMLKAERLRLEVSRSSRSVTVILEDGYESRAGLRRAFEGGAAVPTELGVANRIGGGRRRVYLGAVDPEPWIEALPELVDPVLLARGSDDGMWDLDDLRVQLVRLLHEAAQAGDPRWRLVGLGGVRGNELRDVQFAELDPVTGRAQRRAFADSVRIRLRPSGGVELLLEGGTVRRGTRVAPFLGGKYRIVLPRARADDWRDAALPGIAPPPLRPAMPPAGEPTGRPEQKATQPRIQRAAPAEDSKEIIKEPASSVR